MPNIGRPESPQGERRTIEGPGRWSDPIGDADSENQLLARIVLQVSRLHTSDRNLLLRLTEILSEGDASFREAVMDVFAAQTGQRVEMYAATLQALQAAVARADAARSAPTQGTVSPLEAVLADDWLGPEEDEAWHDL